MFAENSYLHCKAQHSHCPISFCTSYRLLGQLPKANVELLRHLLCLLVHVSSKDSENHMNSLNLAICFGYSILWPSVELNMGENIRKVSEVTQLLIDR